MAGTFNQSLQCTQDVFIGFQAPLPPVRGDEVLKGKSIEGPLRTPTRLDGIVNIFRSWAGTMRIVTGTTSILLIEDSLVLFEALCVGVVDVLGEGHKSRRSRSIGSRHFMWRMGRW